MPILDYSDGLLAGSPQESQALTSAGYSQCQGVNPNPNQQGVPCNFHISPEAQAYITNHAGYYTCPRCRTSHNLIHEEPWTRQDIEPEDWGNSRSGLDVTEIGQLGETIIENMGGLPGYGNFEWFHQGMANSPSPLDAMLPDWGVEIKSILYDALHHRFIPGGSRRRQGEPYDEKTAKNKAAQQAGKQGVLGVLVLLNMRTSKADIYVKEMPLAGWIANGRQQYGVAAFRSNTAQHLVAEVPFKNPYMSPDHPAPQPAAQVDEIPF